MNFLCCLFFIEIILDADVNNTWPLYPTDIANKLISFGLSKNKHYEPQLEKR